MMREYQVRICERLGVKFPGPTRREFVTRFSFRLGDAGDHLGCLAVLGLAGKSEADTVGIVEADAEQPGQLRDGPDIIDAMGFQPRLDRAEAFGRHDKGAVQHGADGIAVARRLLPFRNLEEGKKAVIAHIEKVMTQAPFWKPTTNVRLSSSYYR